MNYEYNRYRVRSPVKSFRDLEVYQKTIQLSDEITHLQFVKSEQDIQEIKSIAEKIPKLIAESYGDRFDSKELAHKKITEAITLVANIITKIDLLREKFSENRESKEILDKLLTRYTTQKRKILNLRKAWDRVYNDDGKNEHIRQLRQNSLLLHCEAVTDIFNLSLPNKLALAGGIDILDYCLPRNRSGTSPSALLEVSGLNTLLNLTNGTQALMFNATGGDNDSPLINTTGIASNVTITSSGGSVIIKLG